MTDEEKKVAAVADAYATAGYLIGQIEGLTWKIERLANSSFKAELGWRARTLLDVAALIRRVCRIAVDSLSEGDKQ